MRKLVDEYMRAHNAHDADAVGALYTPGGTHREVATGGVKDGPAAVTAGLTGFLGAFDDVRWTYHEPIVADGRAALPYTLTARAGALSLEGVVVLEGDDDEIVASADYWDLTSFTRQLGS